MRSRAVWLRRFLIAGGCVFCYDLSRYMFPSSERGSRTLVYRFVIFSTLAALCGRALFSKNIPRSSALLKN